MNSFIAIDSQRSTSGLLTRWFIAFIFFLPWLNIFSARVSNQLPFLIFILYFIFTLSSTYKSTILVSSVLQIFFTICLLLVTAITILVRYLCGVNISHAFFFYGMPLLLLVFAFDNSAAYFLFTSAARKYFAYLLLIGCFAVAIDSVVICFGLDHSLRLMDASLNSYQNTVLGMYGQPSVCSVISILSWLLYSHVRNYDVRDAILSPFSLLNVVTLLMINSGTGYFCFAFSLVYLLLSIRGGRLSKYVLLMIFVVGICAFLASGFSYKFGISYSLSMLNYFSELIHSYVRHNTLMSFLFGQLDANAKALSEYQILINGWVATLGDMGWLWFIQQCGAIYSALVLVLLIYSYCLLDSSYLRLSIIVLFFSSFHYLAIFWVESQLCLCLIIIYSFNYKKLNKRIAERSVYG